MTETRHFLTLNDLSHDEAHAMIQRAIELKAMLRRGEYHEPLKHKVLGMVFDKSSTRTRVSFETGMIHFGGNSIFLTPRDTQLGRGEPLADSARVLSSMLDCVMIRTFDHKTVTTFAEYSSVPVINALTDLYHPCQLLADMMTWVEYRGDIKGKTVAWIGDGNNMCHSYINAARVFEFNLNIAHPDGYAPLQDIVDAGGNGIRIAESPEDAVTGADLVVTDVWASMGQEEEQAERVKVFADYQVNDALMATANKDALFMHCLPAHRGEEVSASVIDGPQSVVWDEAENRLHGQKALLEFLLAR